MPTPSTPRFAVIAPAAAGTTADPEWMVPYAQHVERLGFESLVAVEHPVVVRGYAADYPYASSGRMDLPDDCVLPDPLELLAYLAGHTTRLGLATGVLVLPAHHPVVLAKRLATLDRLSGGRLRVCLGLGWMREEIEACGVDFDSRGRRADEQIEVLRALWAAPAETAASYDGEFFAFDGALSLPKPVRPGGVPLHVGGHSRAAARRAGRLGDGFQPLGVAGEELAALVTVMRDEAARCGRDPDDLQLTLGHLAERITPDRAARLSELGADRVVLAVSPTPDLAAACDELSACAERLGLSAGEPA
jgi:probable F420-dependent oxidoreductase